MALLRSSSALKAPSLDPSLRGSSERRAFFANCQDPHRLDVVAQSLKTGFDPNFFLPWNPARYGLTSEDSPRVTPLYAALARGHWPAAELILARCLIPATCETSGRLSFFGALAAGLMVWRGARDNAPPPPSLLLAARKLGADPRAHGSDEEPALCALARQALAKNGHGQKTAAFSTALTLFLPLGMDLNQRNALGETPLMILAELNAVAEIKAALNAGADPALVDPAGRDASLRAYRAGAARAGDYLSSLSSRSPVRLPSDGRGPLHFAARIASAASADELDTALRRVKRMIAAGQPLLAPDETGLSPLDLLLASPNPGILAFAEELSLSRSIAASAPASARPPRI